MSSPGQLIITNRLGHSVHIKFHMVNLKIIEEYSVFQIGEDCQVKMDTEEVPEFDWEEAETDYFDDER